MLKCKRIFFKFIWNNLLSSHFFEITCSVALSFLKTISCSTCPILHVTQHDETDAVYDKSVLKFN